MWMVDPRILCRKHLLGEHVELHMLVGSILKNKSIRGFIDKKLVDPTSIMYRHAHLVMEMLSRGYKHSSPILISFNDLFGVKNMIDLEVSMTDLFNRCDDCHYNYLNIS